MIPATTRALAKVRPCFPVSIVAPRRAFTPIARTPKKTGDLVLGNIHRPQEYVS